jgi:hypothetical protein
VKYLSMYVFALFVFTAFSAAALRVPVFYGWASLEQDEILAARPYALKLIELTREFDSIARRLNESPGENDEKLRARQQRLNELGSSPSWRVDPLFVKVENQLPLLILLLTDSGTRRRMILYEIAGLD